MKAKNLSIILAVVGLLAAGIVLNVYKSSEPPKSGSASDNRLPLQPIRQNSVWVGTSDTTVISTSSNRVHLDIANNSGATSTQSQTLYCKYGDVASAAYEGFVINASSSKAWNLDNLYVGAIHCRFPSGAANVVVTEF